MAQYTTDENLAKRIAIHGYSVNPVPWGEWYMRHVKILPGMSLLDVGCGNGFLWRGRESLVSPDCEVHLADSSPGMLEAAKAGLTGIGENWRFEVADVQDLPFGANRFDIVMANHMLYHADDIHLAISEIARVTKPDGCVFVSTNGARHMAEVRGWIEEFGFDISAGLPLNVRRFGLENAGAMLEAHFASVELHRHGDSLEVPSVQPILEYIRSMQPPDGEGTRQSLAALEKRLRSELAASGTIRIQKESGLFTARHPNSGKVNHP